MVSTTDLPGNCRRASSHATATPGTSIKAVAPSAAKVVKMAISRISALTVASLACRGGNEEPGAREDSDHLWCSQEREEPARSIRIAAGAHHRGWIDDVRTLRRGNDKRLADVPGRSNVGAIHDGCVGRAAFHRREREADAAGRNDLHCQIRPDAERLQVLLRINARGNRRRIA